MLPHQRVYGIFFIFALSMGALLSRLPDLQLKLGLTEGADVQPLVERLLTIMAQQRADFTRVFAGLAHGAARDEFVDRAAFDAWAAEWQAQDHDPDLMRHANPVRIPRNHRIEEAIAAAVSGDLDPFHRLFDAVTHQRRGRADWDDLAHAPRDEQIVRNTFCGT